MNKKRISRKLLLSTISAIMLAAVLLVVPVLAAATATRDLPATVEPGANFNVGITASGAGFMGQVKETLPAGFTYVSCSDPGLGVEVTGNMVKFTFLGNVANFTYTVTAPATENTYTFAGVVVDESLAESGIGGDTQVEVTEEAPPPPADYPSFTGWLTWWGV